MTAALCATRSGAPAPLAVISSGGFCSRTAATALEEVVLPMWPFRKLRRLPLEVLAIQPEYKVYVRHYPCLPAWDVNFYFV